MQSEPLIHWPKPIYELLEFLYVAFTRHSDGFGEGGTYLRSSTYRLTLNGNLPFHDVWFSNPPGFGNTLVVDGRTIANGTRQVYDELTCPGSGETP